MRRYYFTAAAGVLFLGLLGYVLWSGGTAGTPVTARIILKVEPQKVESLTIRHDGQVAAVLRKVGERWEIEQPRRVRASQEAVQSLLDQVASLEARRVIAEKAEDLSAYGLEPPRAELVMTEAGGTERRLLVGNETPVSSGAPAYYAREGGGAAVYTIDAYLAEQLTGSWDQFRDRTLVALSADEVQAVVVRKGRRSVEARRAGDSTTPEGQRWRLVEPLQAPGDSDAIESVLRDLQFSRISKFVSDDPSPGQLGAWGLKEPAATVELSGGDGTGNASRLTVVLIGGTAPDQERYVQVQGAPSVYTVPESDVKSLLEASVDGWIRRRVVGLSRDDLQRLSVRMSGRPGPLTLEKDSRGRWVLQPGGRSVDQQEADSLLDALVGLRGDRVEVASRVAVSPGGNAPTGAGAPVTMEITVAGNDRIPVTRLVMPVVSEGAGAGKGSQVEVHVEQGEDRLTYFMPASSLQEVERIIAQWTAPPSTQGTASSGR
ncbi:MAG: DUF4340 domain-containing protein [Limnochordaceae bacterium]|nr:DUF4340 domain-containing protein [Limnochordaceae bacterium]